jgi:hypothetical protein
VFEFVNSTVWHGLDFVRAKVFPTVDVAEVYTLPLPASSDPKTAVLPDGTQCFDIVPPAVCVSSVAASADSVSAIPCRTSARRSTCSSTARPTAPVVSGPVVAAVAVSSSAADCRPTPCGRRVLSDDCWLETMFDKTASGTSTIVVEDVAAFAPEVCKMLCVLVQLVNLHSSDHNPTCFKTLTALKKRVCRFAFPKALVEATRWASSTDDDTNAELQVNARSIYNATCIKTYCFCMCEQIIRDNAWVNPYSPVMLLAEGTTPNQRSIYRTSHRLLHVIDRSAV